MHRGKHLRNLQMRTVSLESILYLRGRCTTIKLANCMDKAPPRSGLLLSIDVFRQPFVRTTASSIELSVYWSIAPSRNPSRVLLSRNIHASADTDAFALYAWHVWNARRRRAVTRDGAASRNGITGILMRSLRNFALESRRRSGVAIRELFARYSQAICRLLAYSSCYGKIEDNFGSVAGIYC